MVYRNILKLTLIFISYQFILCAIISGDGNGRGTTHGNGVEIIPGVVTTDNNHGHCRVPTDCNWSSCIFYERCCYEGWCICGTTGREEKCKNIFKPEITNPNSIQSMMELIPKLRTGFNSENSALNDFISQD